jgi:hypothetical protein
MDQTSLFQLVSTIYNNYKYRKQKIATREKENENENEKETITYTVYNNNKSNIIAMIII